MSDSSFLPRIGTHHASVGVSRWIGALMFCAYAGSAWAQGTVLQFVDAVALPGDATQLTLTLSSTAPEPAVFTIDEPARLSLDLTGTRLGLPERSRKLDVGPVRGFSAAEANGRTRLVVDLRAPTPYTVRTSANLVILTFSSSTGSLAQTPSGAAPSKYKPTPASAPAAAISKIDFRRGENGAGRILVTLTDPATSVDVDEEAGKLIARFKGAQLPATLQRRLDVLDFATPVRYVDAENTAIGATITITPTGEGEFEQIAYQSGTLFTLELTPLSQKRQEELQKQQPQYTGERISLSFQSVEIRSLLQIIADVAGTNMVVSDSVSGEIAMRLQNVPWDQALDIILRTKGLGMRQEGNVMLVAPLAEIAQRDKIELETQKQHTELAPLRSEIIQVNYAKAGDLAELLGSSDNALLSERGRVTIDSRTNTLLLLETREKLAEIRNLVERLDIPVRQVLIESRIVIANDDFSRELGARFGVSHVNTLNDGSTIGISGTAEGAHGLGAGSSVTSPTPTSFDSGATGGNVVLDDTLNFDLPASTGAGRIGMAILGADYLVDLELSALQAEGRGEIISTPRVIAANASQASIESGKEIPYQEASSSGATSISFKKAVLSLSVTPQITPDDSIIMELLVTKDSVGEQVSDQFGGSVPSIDTRRMSTQVLVDNGQTVVLGGIFEQENSNSISKVPLLGDIPVFGALFRNKLVVSNKDELLIFVTPKILKESLRAE